MPSIIDGASKISSFRLDKFQEKEGLLVLEGMYWDVVEVWPRYWGSSFPEKAFDLNRLRRFEHEYEYGYREAEYEKAALSATRRPEKPTRKCFSP
jgi:hypothetical protein